MPHSEWTLELCTLGGLAFELIAPADSTVGALRDSARERLELEAQAWPLLCHGTGALADDSLSLQAAGLSDGAQISVVLRRLLRFTTVLSPRAAGTASVALEAHPCAAQGGGGGASVARFQAHAQGYRCAVAEPLPAGGRHAVAFDFLYFQPFMAVGLHADPRQMEDGPMNHYGWIGETPGGACLYQGTRLRHDAADLPLAPGDPMPHRALCSFGTRVSVCLVVDHEAGTLSWLVFLAPGVEPAVFRTELPAAMAGRELSPAVSGTSSTRSVVRVRLEDPARPSWRSGAEPLE